MSGGAELVQLRHELESQDKQRLSSIEELKARTTDLEKVEQQLLQEVRGGRRGRARCPSRP